MLQQDESSLQDYDDDPLLQELLRKQRERYQDEQEKIFRRQQVELGFQEAIRLRKQRERYKEKQQELARRQQEEQRLQEEIRLKEQCSNFRRFLSEYTEEGETYFISYQTLKYWYRAWLRDNELPEPEPFGRHPTDELLKDKFLRD